MRYTYSRWDGTQSEGFDADDLLAAISDEVMSSGDVEAALRRVERWGAHTDDAAIPGLNELLQQLRQLKQDELERYHLDSLMHDVERALSEVVAAERSGVEAKVAQARERRGGEWDDILESLARRKLERLDTLARAPGARLAALADYEFVDDAARERFDALLDQLRQQVLQSHFDSMTDSLGRMTEGEIADLKDMLRDLNGALRDHVEGSGSDFARFAEEHGRYFPGARSFDDIADHIQQQSAYMESIMRSMSPQMRRSLEDTLHSLLWDPEIQEELAGIAETLHVRGGALAGPSYDFSGQESLTLDEALDVMRRLHDLEVLESELKAALEGGSVHDLDASRVRQLMGDGGAHAVQTLQQLAQLLEEAGYVESSSSPLRLTARGMRAIGQRALHDIFRHLDRAAFGNHPISRQGGGGDRADETKPYEFGDTFLLDMPRTLMNAVMREGSGPLHLGVGDFEVFRTEQLAQSSTVLMLDMSRSMPLRGCLAAAKKVALALSTLIRTQFPRDRLYIIGFSDFARELRLEDLHRMTWSDYVYGTNMQHGFLVARRLLARHRLGTKQIILITDGEPTAHMEDNEVHFAYPPTPRTFSETLREAKRCTQEGIVINTFMLERSHYLTEFVKEMTKINRGRAFFATPERLGSYILVDYVARKSGAPR